MRWQGGKQFDETMVVMRRRLAWLAASAPAARNTACVYTSRATRTVASVLR